MDVDRSSEASAPHTTSAIEGAFVICLMGVALNLLVVCGNLFVLYILISQKHLHTATNAIVLSLTISDFLLGLLILPFSILQEYASAWMFGEVVCKTWLALDVCFSTASIYNLLAISFDRYMAVKQPIKYRFISSGRMTKITISVVWIISATLSCPPLIYGHFRLESVSALDGSQVKVCTPMTSADWYILFSAFVSFILPMILMVTLNLSIFYTVSDSARLAEISSTASIVARGTGKQKRKCSRPALSDDLDKFGSVMRVHRGGARTTNAPLSQSNHSLALIKHQASRDEPTRNGDISFDGGHITPPASVPPAVERQRLDHNQNHATVGGMQRMIRLKHIKEAQCSLSFDDELAAALARKKRLRWVKNIHSGSGQSDGSVSSLDDRPESVRSVNSAVSSPQVQAKRSREGKFVQRAFPFGNSHHAFKNRYYHTKCAETATHRPEDAPPQPHPESGTLSGGGDNSRASASAAAWYPAVMVSTLLCRARLIGANRKKSSVVSNFSRRADEKLLLYPVIYFNQRNQLSSQPSLLRTELRVARTIAIVVGCFTVCWMPFTVIYVLQAFQLCPVGGCVPSWLFTFAFWLGYANSAVNPLLYAAFSRDFRFAFRRVFSERTFTTRTSYKNSH